MEPSGGAEGTRLPGESSQELVRVESGGTNVIGRVENNMTFHRYIDLPPELRTLIRAAAIEEAAPDAMSWHWRHGTQRNGNRLALVSKEWQEDVERSLFFRISIDLSIEEDVLRFKELFTEERKRFLRVLGIKIISQETSPLAMCEYLSRISEAMAKVGHFLHYFNRWEVNGDGTPIYIYLVPSDRRDGHHASWMNSLWNSQNLDRFSNFGMVPIDMASWAIKSEFPSSLNMVKELHFSIDCVPFHATREVIQRMPSLTTCSFAVSFNCDSPLGWENLTDLVNQLHTLTPSLRHLRIIPTTEDVFMAVDADSMRKFSAALRNYSQSLECLIVLTMALHQVFFQPFFKESKTHLAMAKWRWPRLIKLHLAFYPEPPYSDPGWMKLTPEEMLIAVGRAAMAMPLLQDANIKAGDHHRLTLTRWLSPNLGRSKSCIGRLKGFDEDGDQRILAAWAPFVGDQNRLYQISGSGELQPFARYYYTRFLAVRYIEEWPGITQQRSNFPGVGRARV
ncbi:hypothetical protein Daus18300_000540 [Diaporthe australafricana]|uniref:DUF6546 domain-containing protein n=1 Tax=Diaporthe australafricana TaxID=127596 RepID=A0ABR3Y3L5_9PEZI